MYRIEDLDKVAVEIKPNFETDSCQLEIPKETTVFFWSTIAVGLPDRIPKVRSQLGSELFNLVDRRREDICMTISVESESIPLLTTSYYRESGYKGLAWWMAFNLEQLPHTLSIQLETDGETPRYCDHEIVFWDEHGNMIPWGTKEECTIELLQSDRNPSDFPDREEKLWNRKTVYIPQKHG